jgi:uncharacterized protein (TIGR00369 family)
MRRLNPDYAKLAMLVANSCPYFKLISMSLKALEVGRCLMEVDLAEKHLQPFGMVHGGVFSSVIDAATFWAVFPEVDEGMGMTTVEMKINYLAPAQRGRLVVEGRRIKLGRTLGLAEASVTSENGKLLAHGTSTLMAVPDLDLDLIERLGLKADELPPKFI